MVFITLTLFWHVLKYSILLLQKSVSVDLLWQLLLRVCDQSVAKASNVALL